jgi:hypothetical protein
MLSFKEEAISGFDADPSLKIKRAILDRLFCPMGKSLPFQKDLIKAWYYKWAKNTRLIWHLVFKSGQERNLVSCCERV